MIVLRVYELDNMLSSIPLELEDDKCYCEHNINGADTLTFEIQRKHDKHIYIFEEVKVEAFGNRFVIKQIDEHSDFSTVNCTLDLDDWKANLNKNFRMVNATIDDVLTALIPTGWSKYYGVGVDLAKRTTVEYQEGEPFDAATSYSILDYVAEAYSVVFNFNAITKSITAINTKSYTSSGEFFMENLNMTDLGYNGDSTEFITRVYAYGKDGMTFADINDGKEYVENTQYSNKVIIYAVSDERYTVKENLKEFAQSILDANCIPQRSYTCNIKNFDGDIWLYKVVTIIDQKRKLRVEHQCVTYREYNDHNLDIITLSSQTPTIESIVKENAEKAANIIESQRPMITRVVQQEVEAATAFITGSRGGYFKWVYDDDGLPIELLNLGDSKDINTAQKVWRWNNGGLGHSNNGYNGPFDIALTENGEINATMITVGILTAELIKAGILSDVAGNNWWNLETGEISLSSTAQFGDYTGESLKQEFNNQNELIAETQENTNEMKRYININPQVPSVSIGTSEDTYVEIGSESMDFISGGNRTVQVTNKDATIPTVNSTTLNMVVIDAESGSMVGNLFWEARLNGHLSLKVRG